MKTHARLRLPPLATLDDQSCIQYAVLDRHGEIQTTGQGTLTQLAELGLPSVHIILHPTDAVVADLYLPPLPRHRLAQAIGASIEPMLLDKLDSVIVAHSPVHRKTGAVQVAWVDRACLLQVWQRLIAAGLPPRSIVPQSLLDMQVGDEAPAASLWHATWPTWSLTDTTQRPSGDSQYWRQAIRLSIAAAAVWVIGLNLYAARLSAQMNALSSHIETTVKDTFPEIPVLLDPLVQARHQLDMLRAQTATPALSEFASLALATSQLPEFAQARVQAMQYQPGQLRLEVLPQSTTLDPRFQGQARHAAGAIEIEKEAQTPNTWLITPGTRRTAQARQ